jgi:hypothetical protein
MRYVTYKSKGRMAPLGRAVLYLTSLTARQATTEDLPRPNLHPHRKPKCGPPSPTSSSPYSAYPE